MLEWRCFRGWYKIDCVSCGVGEPFLAFEREVECRHSQCDCYWVAALATRRVEAATAGKRPADRNLLRPWAIVGVKSRYSCTDPRLFDALVGIVWPDLAGSCRLRSKVSRITVSYLFGHVKQNCSIVAVHLLWSRMWLCYLNLGDNLDICAEHFSMNLSLY